MGSPGLRPVIVQTKGKLDDYLSRTLKVLQSILFGVHDEDHPIEISHVSFMEPVIWLLHWTFGTF